MTALDELTPDAAIASLTAAVHRQLARLEAHDWQSCDCADCTAHRQQFETEQENK